MIATRLAFPTLLAVPLALSGCATVPELPAPQERFWQALASHCGSAYAGALASGDARDADWQGRRAVAHWADCRGDRIAIALHIEDGARADGWDRSRTWLVSRTGADAGGGLRLKHDHRHPDGSEDTVTQYGGDTAGPGTAAAQDFPVDDFSIALFGQEGLDASVTNVWRMEAPATPGGRFAYQLTRTGDPTRRFRLEFDTGQPVTPPPAAWGW